MDLFDDNYYILNRKLMSLLGLWYTKVDGVHLLRLVIIGAMLFYFALVQFCGLFTVDSDLQSTLFALQTFMPCVCNAGVYYLYIIKLVSVKKLLNYIREDCLRLEDEAELRIMQRYVYECKFCTMINGLIGILFIGFYIVPPVLHRIFLFDEEKSAVDRFPIFACHDYFLDTKSYYYPIMIYQAIVTVVEFMVLITCSSGYFIVLEHVCALLTIIKEKIQQRFINNHCDDNFLATPVDHFDWIIDIARRLSRSREIINTVNTAFENYYLFQISLACIFIIINILYLFQMPDLLKHTESKDMLMFIVFIIGSFFAIFTSCFMGQRLINYSMDVYNEACFIPIYNVSLKTQKLLLTMIILNDKPIRISVGKVFDSSLQFFQSLIRTAISFAMMLHSTQAI